MITIEAARILNTRIPIFITLFLLFASTALPGAAGEGPPCCPCAGATVADPLDAARQLAAAGAGSVAITTVSQVFDPANAVFEKFVKQVS